MTRDEYLNDFTKAYLTFNDDNLRHVISCIESTGMYDMTEEELQGEVIEILSEAMSRFDDKKEFGKALQDAGLEKYMEKIPGFFQNFYFTYGTDPQFPHLYDQYVLIKATDEHEARETYRGIYPGRNGSDCLNCAFVYNQKEWEEEVHKYYEGDPVAAYKQKVFVSEKDFEKARKMTEMIHEMNLTVCITGLFNGVDPKMYMEDGLGRFLLSDLGITYYDGEGLRKTVTIPLQEMESVTDFGEMASEFFMTFKGNLPLSFEDLERACEVTSLNVDYDCDPSQTTEDYWQVGFITFERDGREGHIESAVLDKFNEIDADKFKELYGFYPDVNERAAGDLENYDFFDGDYPEEEMEDEVLEEVPDMEEELPF